MHRNLENVSTKSRRIAELAVQSPQMGFTSLAHHMDIDWLKEAWHRTRKDGAAGVDGVTAREYEKGLEGNLRSLLERAKSGTYRAPAVRRVHIPKGDSGSETRPIGVPTLEDKVLQRGVAMLLEPIYEQDFYGCSFGFRPGRGAHDALDALWKEAMYMGSGWIVDVDIRKFFDTLDHAHLREFVSRRVRDGVVLKLIGKWLNAGVMEKGGVSYPDSGSPQGGVISPLLANIYLHYVLDEWFFKEVKPRLKGGCFIVRYADDFVLGFKDESDARRVMDVLPKRFEKYGLAIHPDKTRLLRFGPEDQKQKDDNGSGTFDFLGFTHYWSKSMAGKPIVKRKTAAGRLKRALAKVQAWCRKNMHLPVSLQRIQLALKLRGHCAYYGVTCNAPSLSRYRERLLQIWRRWLNRRDRQKSMTWEVFTRLVKQYPLPEVRVVHSVYRQRK